MRFAAASALVIASVLMPSHELHAASCENELVAELELHVDDNDVFIPANVGGRDVYFALRGNAGVPVLLQPGVDALGIKARAQNGTGQFKSGERRVTQMAKMEKIRLGDFRMADRMALVDPDSTGDILRTIDGRPVVGAMGATLFQYMDIELDVGSRKIKVFRPFSCRKRSPVYWNADAPGHPMRFDETATLVFTLELEGRRVESSLLSGAGNSTIDVKATRQFFGFDESSPGVESMQTASGRSRGVFHAMALTGRGLEISNAKVQLRPGPDCKLSESVPVHRAIGYADCINVVPFTLGIDLLKRLRIYTSRERQQIYFTRN